MDNIYFKFYFVFPASAGVILGCCGIYFYEMGFPRIRGGDPKNTSARKKLFMFSPHPRG